MEMEFRHFKLRFNLLIYSNIFDDSCIFKPIPCPKKSCSACMISVFNLFITDMIRLQ